ncbi:MAG: phosphoenolpyruvate carboxylase [Bacteroidetes bacterium]|nr:phosphoenolpyruvate carboxylase [Bacteroidota bacterium]
MINTNSSLKSKTINMLGEMLGDIIQESMGPEIFDRLESIRRMSKAAHSGDDKEHRKLVETLRNLPDGEILPVVKAFNQFLNLANTAEQYEGISTHGRAAVNPIDFEKIYRKLKEGEVSEKQIQEAISAVSINLVLTAHPTEINRRSLINKLNEVNACLHELDHDDLVDYEKQQIHRRLKQIIAQYWHTDEIRKNRPTPVEEAKWGYDVIETSLWEAVPAFIRELDEQMQATIGFSYPVDARPIQFTTWMGSDRDGNPNVTAAVTSQILLKSRHRAASLFLKDVQVLVTELSMSGCTEGFRRLVDSDTQEPYREYLKILRKKLQRTIQYLDARLAGRPTDITDIITKTEELWDPLYACYQSLVASDMSIIANDHLLDTLRRVRCFGITLVQIDVRQESTRHTEALSELTRYLGLGDYESWSEDEKQAFLVRELNSKRPLIPQNWNPSADTKEVLDTCQVIAGTPHEAIAAYVISMTRTPSDILAVHLLLKEAGTPYILAVAPLFETLNDLNNAKTIMEQLFSVSWYRGVIGNKQMVMIGYSDSAKDAGAIAAGWAQYRAQEALIEICHQQGITLTLFHGRGGTIGRGGAPAQAALFSQPPGSLQGGLRVTEQGEMIRFKLGLPKVAVSTFIHYFDAILEANLLPPPVPKDEWRVVMDKLSDISCEEYQGIVRGNPDFIPYFYQATPEAELAKLPLGSRPAKRRPNGGVESLRAIPWIFGWSQNRLMLPAWLGAGKSLRQFIAEEGIGVLETMYSDWPFFKTRISMLEMVFAKADTRISEYYDERLVEEHLLPLGEYLRSQLKEDIKTVLEIAHDKSLMETLPEVAKSVAARNIYTNPLNLLQVELLYRSRVLESPSSVLEQAMMVTISGIAAGTRNTG